MVQFIAEFLETRRKRASGFKHQPLSRIPFSISFILPVVIWACGTARCGPAFSGSTDVHDLLASSHGTESMRNSEFEWHRNEHYVSRLPLWKVANQVGMPLSYEMLQFQPEHLPV